MNNIFYQHQSVRDLAWVISSPPLMTLPDVACHDLERHDGDVWLKQLDSEPDVLEHAIDQMKRPILGAYFETLVAFGMEHQPESTILATNLQVREDKLTIGEFDFILHTPSSPSHVEVAVKFYLQTHSSSEWHHWIGPRAHDRLDNKMDKLLQHQLRLSTHPSGQKMLESIGIDYVDPKLLFKGYFFYPYDQYISGQMVAPLHANPHHLKGWWCRINEIDKLKHYSCLWAIPNKLSWLSPACYQSSEQLMPYKVLANTLEYHFKGNDSALLLTALAPNEQGTWIEQHRGFILPENWPEVANFPL